MLKSLSIYEAVFDLVSKASDPVKPVLPKSLSKFRDRLDDQFIVMNCDWKAYKEDTGLETEEFNKVDVETGQPVVKHNDEWFDALQAAYIDLCEKSDDTLEKQAGDRVTVSEDSKADQEMRLKVEHEKKVGILLISQIEAEIETAVLIGAIEHTKAAVSIGAIEHTKAAVSIGAIEHTKAAVLIGDLEHTMTEMRKYCGVEEFQHVRGYLNPADLATRGLAKATELGPESFWQQGPFFLSLRRDLWPVNREFVKEELPDEEAKDGIDDKRETAAVETTVTYKDLPADDGAALLKTPQMEDGLVTTKVEVAAAVEGSVEERPGKELSSALVLLEEESKLKTELTGIKEAARVELAEDRLPDTIPEKRKY